ncbi:MAG: ATP-binding cassette domain-containing protein [Bacilli bacterium]
MLELRNIDKTYKPKNGKPVHALNNISIKFEEKGMVFILGKSGCGKSTLLNVIGGLDKFDSGEIIIKGKSSKEFSGSDFDSYRNTFVGFIFQEYNILSEFNIAKNIALALELQGKKATPAKVQELLDMVDLSAQGNRKTTELSGGQKQRVAIARALIKDPEIIIADEPTGALDSATGAQVFDTLKKLSKDKLVIIVSHDREYAEQYADRIIEMKDGVVIGDDTKRYVEPKSVANNIDLIGDNIIRIAPNHMVTNDEVEQIVKILNKSTGEKIISCDKENNDKFKQLSNISEEGKTEIFTETTSSDHKDISYDKNELKFIKSKLRLRDSFKMGASGLKNKPFRLFMTILLSLVSFTMFGLADTFASYNKEDATVQSFIDSDFKSLCFSGEKQQISYYYDVDGNRVDSYYYNSANMSNAHIELLKEKTGLNVKPIYTPGGNNFSLETQLFEKDAIIIGTYNNSYFSGYSTGFVEMTNEDLKTFDCEIIEGRLPTNNKEIAITKYIYELFDYCGIKQEGEVLTLSDICSYVYKYEDSNNDGEVTSTELEHINLFSEEFNTVLTKEDFLAKGPFYVTKYVSQDDITKEDLYMLTENNLEWNSVVGLDNLNEIKVVFNEYTLLEAKNISSYHDVIGATLAYYNYEVSETEYYKIVGVVDTKLDDSKYQEKKEKSINKTIGSLSSSDYSEMQAFSELIDYSLHSVTFVAPGFVDAHINPIMKLSNTDDAFFLIAKDYNYDGLHMNDGIRRLYFTNTTEYNPADVAFLNGYTSSKTSLNDDEFVIDFKVAMESLYNYYIYKSSEDISFYTSDEYIQFDEYYSKLNSNNGKALLSDSTFRQWLINNFDKYYITSAEYPPYSNDDMLAIRNDDYKIVGLYMHSFDDSFKYWEYNYTLIGSSTFLAKYGDGVYAKAISTMPTSTEELKKLIKNYYQDEENNELFFKFQIRNSVMSSIDFINEFIEETSSIFLYVGIFFSVFAGLMLANFISVSITYKKREIGILRAIGARKKDVFSIFFNESVVIAFINFILSAISTGVVAYFINKSLRLEAGFNITLLLFGPRQIILIALISLLVALLASALPVYRIARKQPIDAINNR